MPNPNDKDRPSGQPGDDDRPALEQDLHATTDSIRSDLARLSAVEMAKTALDPADPELDRLSNEAVTLADGLARKTRAERELGEDLA